MDSLGMESIGSMVIGSLAAPLLGSLGLGSLISQGSGGGSGDSVTGMLPTDLLGGLS
ncbi:hypothetical protein G6016_04995 [Dietzia aerolata]|uniref:Uncharacterized protein n=1 Tax=Dietzia aerolata TaxID=595984 RepID=A0ABV5JS67_9ACTN|nr:hypothetical protein [Dietzia aerolata]MBB0968327.1 hypothetical protein [Dietzia aerolata]HIW66732.1 hypothetical protein [Candidatus Dietzia merdigallinarum]